MLILVLLFSLGEGKLRSKARSSIYILSVHAFVAIAEWSCCNKDNMTAKPVIFALWSLQSSLSPFAYPVPPHPTPHHGEISNKSTGGRGCSLPPSTHLSHPL